MTIDDLTEIAKLWAADNRLPEPDTVRVSRPGERIELNYLDPGVVLPELAWRDSLDGHCLVHEEDVDGVHVSVFALKAVAV